MDESDPAFLRKQASKCWRLAESLFDRKDAAKLEALAREYEAQARAAETRLDLKLLPSEGPLKS